MPDPHYPPAVWDPGATAGGSLTTMQSVVCHYTVGRNSTPIGKRGFFNFLVGRDGTVTQFAEANVRCWHAGDPWNGRGPGVEVEYLPGVDDELWTPAQEQATGALCDWLRAEWGVPGDFYDGPRIASWPGFITHRSLIQTGDQHSDWWPYLPTAGDTDVALDLSDFAWMQNNISGQGIDGQTNITNRMVLDAVLAIGAVAPGGGVTEAQVRQIVRDELDKTKLGS